MNLMNTTVKPKGDETQEGLQVVALLCSSSSSFVVWCLEIVSAEQIQSSSHRLTLQHCGEWCLHLWIEAIQVDCVL
jgi:hypothetical protein